MCCDEDNSGVPLSFDGFVKLLQEPPFEPCERELDFLTPAKYQDFFDETMSRYSKRITHFISRIIEDPSRAAELTQDVFISLYKARISFEPSYIYRAAKNAAISELRRRNLESRILHAHWAGVRLTKEQKSKELDTPDPQPLPDAVFLKRARADALRRAVARLPERFRVTLALLAEGKSYKQIMTMTQTNEGTVKARICRGKRLLRCRLRAYL
jgi:RNA polymerase sigma-70 factor (ECF subfamily)